MLYRGWRAYEAFGKSCCCVGNVCRLGNGLAVLPVGNLGLHLSSALGSVHHAFGRKPLPT